MQWTAFSRRFAGLSLALACSAAPVGCGKDTTQVRSGGGDVDGNDGDKVTDGGTTKRDAGRDAKVDNSKPDAGSTMLGDGTDKCAGLHQDAPPATGGVDVVFIIDTSGSMLHALTQVQMNMATFVQNFEGTGADTHVVVITENDPAAGTPVANDADKYRFISSQVDSKVLFQVALQRFDGYKNFLRPGAATMFVMVTDDNDRIAPADFKSQMEGKLGHGFIQHAIASEDVGGLPCTSEAQMWNPLCVGPIPAICAAAAIGRNYYTLADQTGGVKLSICKADWVPVFDQLRTAVIEAVPLPCSYSLDAVNTSNFDAEKVQVVYTPANGGDEEFGRATTQGACGTKNGWYYDNNDDPKSIQLCPSACDTVAAGGSLDLAFGCAPITIF